MQLKISYKTKSFKLFILFGKTKIKKYKILVYSVFPLLHTKCTSTSTLLHPYRVTSFFFPAMQQKCPEIMLHDIKLI